jgi:hypothetical protein
MKSNQMIHVKNQPELPQLTNLVLVPLRLLMGEVASLLDID